MLGIVTAVVKVCCVLLQHWSQFAVCCCSSSSSVMDTVTDDQRQLNISVKDTVADEIRSSHLSSSQCTLYCYNSSASVLCIVTALVTVYSLLLQL